MKNEVLPVKIRGLGAVIAGALWGLFSFSVMANESASLMTFYTEGPDCYADGTQVLDGEYYALVYQTAAAGDVKFTLDCKIAGETNAIPSAVLLRALPRAEDGKCPYTTFAVDSDALPTLSGTGMLRLYLLDTRVFDANGVATVGGLASVQASVPVTATCKVEMSSTSGAVSGGFSSSILPAEVPTTVTITGIEIKDGKVVLTVDGTYDGINYELEDPISDSGERIEAAVTGRTGEPVKFTVPCGSSTSGFFSVKRK